MNLPQLLSDQSIMNTLNVLKSDYFIATGIVLGILTYIVKKINWQAGKDALNWIKGKLGR